MVWDHRWENFVKKNTQSYCPLFMLKIGFGALSCALFDQYSLNFEWELILGRSVMGLQMI